MMTMQQKYQLATGCARRYEDLVARRARAVFNAAYGHDTRVHFECFHLAHNWLLLASNTPAQHDACALVRQLDHQRWAAARLRDAWLDRVQPFAYHQQERVA